MGKEKVKAKCKEIPYSIDYFRFLLTSRFKLFQQASVPSINFEGHDAYWLNIGNK